MISDAAVSRRLTKPGYFASAGKVVNGRAAPVGMRMPSALDICRTQR